MFSVQNELVMDPFVGTGTTTVAAMAAGRDSVGIELDTRFRRHIEERVMGAVAVSNSFNRGRISDHQAFVKKMRRKGRELKHTNRHYGFPVMTGQEERTRIPVMKSVEMKPDGSFEARYR